MQPNRHRIQRQVIELGLAPGMPGPEAQEALAIEMRERAIPELTAVFDKVAGPHELLGLDRLEIDLGAINSDNWTPNFCKRLVIQMARELARFTPEVTRGGPASPDETLSTDTMRQFLFFLAHGRLPWWGARPEGGFSATFARERGTLDWKAVRSAVVGNVRACHRLIDCLEDELLEEAIARWAGLPHALCAMTALTPASLTGGEKRAWRDEFWRTLFDWVLSESFHSARVAVVVDALRAVRCKFAGASRVPPADRNRLAAPPREKSERLAAGLLSPWREWLAASPGGTAAVTQPEAVREPERALTEPPTPLRAKDEAAPRASLERLDEAIFLPCAGIVLLHPFFEALFRERGLLDGRKFLDSRARERAIHLIGLLGFGAAKIPEYDLVLAKLLCAHPLAESITPVTLDGADIAACDTLLGAVLGHWTALRSSSAQWLRTQFFLRDGKLENVDSGFRLTVERRAQDVLLTRLPWGLGVIELPWTKERIFVHWLD